MLLQTSESERVSTRFGAIKRYRPLQRPQERYELLLLLRGQSVEAESNLLCLASMTLNCIT